MVMRRDAEAVLKEQLRARFVELYGAAQPDVVVAAAGVVAFDITWGGSFRVETDEVRHIV